MNDDASFDKFKACAIDVLQVPPDKVVREARFGDDLDADSLDLVELVMALEEAFDVKVVAVNTMTVQGKERRRRNSRGFDPKRKKAIVTLAPGQQIGRLFETSSG